MRQVIGQQGEVKVIKIDSLPEITNPAEVEKNQNGAFIISHSESGHHHVIDGGEVMERTKDVPEGMRIIYAILDEPTALIQDAGNPHGHIDLEPGNYEFRISREYDPFLQQARRVAD